ncbi:MAG TPA: carbon storage regulator [Pirellulales bacterium]|jgi:carbon storage regulator CsrA|nr:carbon storage regulator [Pirellulales bacterium]
MLVLSRKVGEKIVVDDNVTIVINRISGQRVSIGIEAPRGMRVVRSELRPRDDLAGHRLDDGFSDPTDTSVVSAETNGNARPLL